MKTRTPRPSAGPDGDPPPVADGSVRVDALTGMPGLLRRFGIEPARFLVDAGLDPGRFDDAANEIPLASLGRLLGLAVERTGCRCFGLLVGEHSGLTSLSLVGLLARHSPDVGAALRNLSDHQELRDRAGVVPLTIRGGVATLDYAIYQTGIDASDQVYDAAIAIMMNVMRNLCGPDWRPSEVLFCHRKPADPGPFRTFFGAPLRFDAERTALVFPTTWLRRRLSDADPAAYRRLQQRIEAIEARAHGDLVEDVRRILRTLLLDGRGSVESVAGRLALHRRTLNRRLEASGTSVHELLEETRFEVARQLVESTRMPLVRVSAALGYADASAFTRAFRRWSGSTPIGWRQNASPHRVVVTP